MEKNIAIVILNYIQFINVKPGIDELIKKGHKLDIYCPISEDTDGFKELFEDNVQTLLNQGYTVYRTIENNKKYKILLEPYPCMNIEAKYKIKYRYGTISAKPNIVYGNPQNFIFYDAILCAGKYDANYLNVFSKTYLTGNMKYINFKKKKKTEKKVLLYLPTYGECSSIDLIGDYLGKLKKNYHIIAKIHHGTAFLKNELYRIEKIKNNVDEFYVLHKDLSELLEIADVVLTDNSGSIFEALYAEVPIAIFSNDINQNKWGQFNTTQYELYKKNIIPYTNNVDNIEEILNKALSPSIKQKQNEWNRKNLYHPSNQIKDFVNIIEMYLNDQIDKRYFDFHSEFKNNYFKLYNYKNIAQEELKQKNILINNLKQENIKNEKNFQNQIQNTKKLLTKEIEKNELLIKELEYYKSGKLYKLANKIYKLKNGGK